MECNNKQLLTAVAKGITDNGGEGVIMQKPASLYIPGRSMDLLKFKV
jgi:hypothetical protein